MKDSNTNRNDRRQFLGRSTCGAVAILAGVTRAQAEPLVTTTSELQEVNRIRLPSIAARRIAASPAGGVWLAADTSVQHLTAQGDMLLRIELARPARCLAVNQDGISVGVRDSILQYSTDGELLWTSPSVGTGHLIGDLHVESSSVCVTDVTSGDRLQIGPGDSDPRWSRLNTKAEFKIAPSNRLVRHGSDQWMMTEPGRHRVVLLDDAGRIIGSWGSRSREVDGFQGCCNPMAIAELPNGNWVTAEAGQVRIKRFDASGQFMHQIAGPDSITEVATTENEDSQLRCRIGGIDLATSRNGDLWVLHAAAQQIIHYRPQV
jgi:hypothetical protein